jgi:5-methylcytosine-specific restriction endonuclease McrA
MGNNTSRNERGLCIDCGEREQMANGTQYGHQRWKRRCSRCHKSKYGMATHSKRHAYRDSKGDKCERCGFVPEHSVQLDVDHVDGNNSNNAPSNLQTLCANCHRLKSYLAGDGMFRRD